MADLEKPHLKDLDLDTEQPGGLEGQGGESRREGKEWHLRGDDKHPR